MSAKAFEIPLASLAGIHRRLEAAGSGRKCWYVKIYGERNTGSNYFSRLFSKNYFGTILRGDTPEMWELAERLTGKLGMAERISTRTAMHDYEMNRILATDFGWKHSAPPVEVIMEQAHSLETLFVILTKHPYSWAESLFRNPYSYEPIAPNFSEFIRAPFATSFSDCLPMDVSYNPLTMFRAKVLRYMDLMNTPLAVVHIRYEDILRSVLDSLAGIDDYFLRQRGEISDINDDVKGSMRVREDFLRAYSLAKAGSTLTEEDRAFIVASVGEDVFAFLGYEK